MKKKIAVILIGATITALAAGCGNQAQDSANSNSPAPSQTTGTTVNQTDNTGTAGQNQGGTQSSAQGQNNNTGAGAQGQANNNAGASQGQAGTAGNAAGISAEEAKNIALNAAGVKEADTISLVVKQDYDDGFQLYDVSIYTPTQDYDYDISMADGAILKQDMEYVNQVSSINSQTAVTPEAAKNTALGKVSGATDKNIRMKLDMDDGRYTYEGEIIMDNISYDFEIDAQTGNVYEWSQESLAY